MCRLFLANRNGLDCLGPENTERLFDRLELSMGGHGNGIAYVVGDKLFVNKGVDFTVQEAVEAAFETGAEWFLFHTRWASMGDINDRNCHPFQCGRIVAAMNGTESGLKFLTKAMGGITDTEASVVSIAAKARNLKPIGIARRFAELTSVFVGFIKVNHGYQPFASVGSDFGDLQVYLDKEVVIMASELPLKAEDKVFNALQGFSWAGGPVSMDKLTSYDKEVLFRGMGGYSDYTHFDDFHSAYNRSKSSKRGLRRAK